MKPIITSQTILEELQANTASLTSMEKKVRSIQAKIERQNTKNLSERERLLDQISQLESKLKESQGLKKILTKIAAMRPLIVNAS